MVLLITGTISPSNEMKNTVLTNVEDRLNLYIETVNFYITKSPIKKIVFCENSNFKTNKFEPLFDNARKQKKQFEYIRFQGNINEANIHGKGYGDGEIIDYALEKSVLLKSDNYFIKLTGKRMILNSNSFFKKIDENRAYFNRLSLKDSKMIDAALYACPIGFYKENFGKAYLNLSDDIGYWAENKYAEIIINNKLKTYNFPVFPRIEGVSGSCGSQIKNTLFKFLIKNFLSKFNLYNIR